MGLNPGDGSWPPAHCLPQMCCAVAPMGAGFCWAQLCLPERVPKSRPPAQHAFPSELPPRPVPVRGNPCRRFSPPRYPTLSRAVAPAPLAGRHEVKGGESSGFLPRRFGGNFPPAGAESAELGRAVGRRQEDRQGDAWGAGSGNGAGGTPLSLAARG